MCIYAYHSIMVTSANVVAEVVDSQPTGFRPNIGEPCFSNGISLDPPLSNGGSPIHVSTNNWGWTLHRFRPSWGWTLHGFRPSETLLQVEMSSIIEYCVLSSKFALLFLYILAHPIQCLMGWKSQIDDEGITLSWYVSAPNQALVFPFWDFKNIYIYIYI